MRRSEDVAPIPQNAPAIRDLPFDKDASIPDPDSQDAPAKATTGESAADLGAPLRRSAAGASESLFAGVARRAILCEVAVVALLLVASFLVLRGPSHDQGFSIDESRWIATSRYFWITFIDRDLFGPFWQPNYVVYTHPPVARYIIGFGLWLQGWTPDELNGRYESLESRSYNDRMGNIPEPDLLWAARNVTLVFAVAAVALTYLVGRQVGGIPAGLAAAGLTLVNPLLTAVWTRALAESLVATFSLLALTLALWVMPRVASLGRQAWLPLALGASLALAAATKLNGGLATLALGVFALVQQAFAVAETRRTRGFRSWVDVGLAAIVLFVAVNPLLYVMPVERTVSLIRHRHDEMEFQRQTFNSQAVPDELSARVSRVAKRAFDDYATPKGSLPISTDVILVPLGLGLLAWRSILELRRRTPGPSFMLLCWVLMTYAVITPNLGFDSSHYFTSLVSLNMLTSGVAMAFVLGIVCRRGSALAARRQRRPDAGRPQNIQVPSR